MMSYILKVVQGLDNSFNRESGGSHSRPNGEACGIQPTLHGSEKSATGSPSTPTSGPSKCYKLLNLDGSKPIAQVVMMKTAPGSLVHGRLMLSYEVKVNVIKVFPVEDVFDAVAVATSHAQPILLAIKGLEALSEKNLLHGWK
ncbi:hypothetical protein LguiB_034386 [Lonicera macranthoides]